MSIDSQNSNHGPTALGAPAWVSPELLADTIETWQPYYADTLTDSDSLEILLAISRLIDALHNRAPVLETDE